MIGLQDFPPGLAPVALAARADVGPEAIDELVIVHALRGAAVAVRARRPRGLHDRPRAAPTTARRAR